MMRRSLRSAVGIAACTGIAAAVALPGTAGAQSSGDATAYVTRAVLLQANAEAEVARATLITQIQVDGQGEVSFAVPTVEGGDPSNMDSFGGPDVENGEAVYTVDADGPETFRTAQDFDPAVVPVDLDIKATLDGRPIEVSELTGVTGEVVLEYTARNTTGTETTLEYQDGSGATLSENITLTTAMGGTLDIVFPPSWAEISSEDATVVSGDGTGDTQVSGSWTLFEPFGEPEGTIAITAQVTDADMPPANLKFTVLQPQDNPTARALSASLAGGAETGTSIYDAGAQLEDGATQLEEGLAEASAGADEIASGVANTLQPGVNELNDGVQNTLAPGVNELNDGVQNSLVPGVNQLVNELGDLPGTVTGSADFQQITGGFASLDGAIEGVRDSLGVFSSSGAGQYLTAGGDIDKTRTTAARTLWSLIYGVRAADVPADSAATTPTTDTGGLTNPACSLANPTDPANPCGAWQVIKAVSEGLSSSTTGLPAAKAGVDQSQAAIDTQILPGVAQSKGGVDQISAGLTGQAIPGLAQIQGGLDGAFQQLTSMAPPDGGAFAIATLANLLGCALKAPPAGATGPIVDGAIPCANVTGTGPVAAAVLEGLTTSIYKAADPANPANSGLAALLGQVLSPATGQVSAGVGDAAAGLGQVSAGLGQVEGGLGQVSAGLGQVSAGLGAAGATAPAALNELLLVITSQPNGNPDPNTQPGNTATGILSELRAALALGGVGSNGIPGKCAGYNTPGDPKSGLNPSATPDQIAATCAAADVLNVARLVSGVLATGISTTLLQGISDQLVAGVQPLAAGAGELAAGSQQLADGVGGLAAGTQQLADGVGPLAAGTQQLAAGLPDAVAGANTIVNDAAKPLQESGNEAAVDFARQVALYDAMNNQELVDTYIPGGPAEGESVRSSGVYSFELAGTGSGGIATGANLALALLGLAGAGLLGVWLGSRNSG